jgi:type III secretion protein J
MGVGALGCVLALLLLGCNAVVAAGLDETDANQIVVALDRANVDGQKEVDPTTEGKFRVLVARDDVASALSAMRAEELPRPKPAGVLESMDKGALVPSQAAEHAQLVVGTAGEIERTLLSIDGVLAARVHLSLPARDPLRDTAPTKATASVLVEHRGAAPPITVDAIQRLVAGGVTNLAPADVVVVTVPRPAPPQAREAQLAHVGPIAVARGSQRPLQGMLGALVASVLVFAGITLALYLRLARMRAEAQNPPK